jgi:glycosyltransferase involved in cell wall biosynthesis
MKLVLAHDYLIQMGGAERVVAAMHRHFPAAPIYTSAVSRETLWDDFAGADIRTSLLQHAPGIQDHVHFKKYFPLFGLAFQSFGKIEADCAWISSSTFAKFLHFTPNTRTVCYIHSPTRFLWQTDSYLAKEVPNSAMEKVVRATLPTFRSLDRLAALRMDVLVANSRNVQARIREHYGVEARVIYPPVQTHRFSPTAGHDGTYLIVSRLLGYKNIELAVRAFSRCGRRLLIIGEGPDREMLERKAGESVTFLGWLSEEETKRHFEKCRALVVPGHEDFAIAPVEAMAAGKPVIAIREGGVLETVVDGETGFFFDENSEESLLDAVDRFERTSWDTEHIRLRAEEFSEERFLAETETLLRACVGGERAEIPVFPDVSVAVAEPTGADRRDLSELGVRRREVFGLLLDDIKNAGLQNSEAREFLLVTLKSWRNGHDPEAAVGEDSQTQREEVFQELLHYLEMAGLPEDQARGRLMQAMETWEIDA